MLKKFMPPHVRNEMFDQRVPRIASEFAAAGEWPLGVDVSQAKRILET